MNSELIAGYFLGSRFALISVCSGKGLIGNLTGRKKGLTRCMYAMYILSAFQVHIRCISGAQGGTQQMPTVSYLRGLTSAFADR
jgi:hypothetical protein